MTTPPKKPRPDNSPFDFNLDAVKSEVDLAPFVVQFGGRRWIFGHLSDLNVWDLVAGVDAGDLQAGMQVFETALGADQFAEFKRLPLPQYKLEKLFEAYQKHCGVEPGESVSSTDS